MLTMNEVVRKCKAAIESHYGSQLKGLILYGSVARNQADFMSDIDLLVLLLIVRPISDAVPGISTEDLDAR